MILWLLVRVLVEWIMKVTCVHLMRCHYTLTYNFIAFIYDLRTAQSAQRLRVNLILTEKNRVVIKHKEQNVPDLRVFCYT